MVKESEKELRGNCGEWSEPYVVLRLMADGKLYQADANMLPDKDDFAYVLSANRGDVRADVRDDGVVVFTYKDANGNECHVEAQSEKLNGQANRLFKAICAIKKIQGEKNGSFSLPEEDVDLKRLGFHHLKSSLADDKKIAKRDIELRVTSPKLGHATLGFSVKSRLGSPASLLNASAPTNIVYRIKGLTKDQANAINLIEGSRKVMDRCRAIRDQATSIAYEAYCSQVFFDNLELVDSALPEMVADLLKVHYFEQILLPRTRQKNGVARSADRLSLAVELLSKTDKYATKALYENKVNTFTIHGSAVLVYCSAWE